MHSQTDRTEPGEKEKEWEEKEFEIIFAKSFGIGETITYLCTPNRKEGKKSGTKTHKVLNRQPARMRAAKFFEVM